MDSNNLMASINDSSGIRCCIKNLSFICKTGTSNMYLSRNSLGHSSLWMSKTFKLKGTYDIAVNIQHVHVMMWLFVIPFAVPAKCFLLQLCIKSMYSKKIESVLLFWLPWLLFIVKKEMHQF